MRVLSTNPTSNNYIPASIRSDHPVVGLSWLVQHLITWVWSLLSNGSNLSHLIVANISRYQWTWSLHIFKGSVPNLLAFRSTAMLQLLGQTRKPLLALFVPNITYDILLGWSSQMTGSPECSMHHLVVFLHQIFLLLSRLTCWGDSLPMEIAESLPASSNICMVSRSDQVKHTHKMSEMGTTKHSRLF